MADERRKVRNALRSTMSADSMERTLAGLQESLWPGGGTRPPSVPRTDTEKTETRIRASKKLGLLIPGMSGYSRGGTVADVRTKMLWRI